MVKLLNPVFQNSPNLIISIEEDDFGNCFVIQKDGLVSFFQLDPFALNKELNEWRQIIGYNNQQLLSLVTEYDDKKVIISEEEKEKPQNSLVSENKKSQNSKDKGGNFFFLNHLIF